MTGHICVSRCRPNAHLAFEGRNTADALVKQLEDGKARVEKQSQFWRDSEQQWVDHVNIHRDEIPAYGGTTPMKWRTREITTVTHVGEWREGRK